MQDYRHVGNPRALTEAGLFLAEGRLVAARLLAAAARVGPWHGSVQSVLLSPAASVQLASLLTAHPHVPVYIVAQETMNALAGFNIHRGCLALARRPADGVLDDAAANALAAQARRLVVLEGVNNPDNIGGIFRSASALGADMVVLGPGCGDPLYRKAVRTSMGAVLDVPWRLAPDWPASLDVVRRAGFTVVALTPDASAVPLPSLAVGSGRLALLAGAEGTGLTAAALAAADLACTIPMASRGADSLNVATAVAIALYHLGMERPA